MQRLASPGTLAGVWSFTATNGHIYTKVWSACKLGQQVAQTKGTLILTEAQTSWMLCITEKAQI